MHGEQDRQHVCQDDSDASPKQVSLINLVGIISELKQVEPKFIEFLMPVGPSSRCGACEDK